MRDRKRKGQKLREKNIYIKERQNKKSWNSEIMIPIPDEVVPPRNQFKRKEQESEKEK